MENRPAYLLNDVLFLFIKLDIEDVLIDQFSNMIITPLIYEELSLEPYVKEKLDNLIKNKIISVKDIKVFSNEFEIFMELSCNDYLGDNSASLLAKAYVNNGIFVCCYIEDFKDYLNKYNIDSLSFEEILDNGIKKDIINHEDIIDILDKMEHLKVSFKEEYLLELRNKYHIN